MRRGPRSRAIALKSLGTFWMESGDFPLPDPFNAESVSEYSPGQAAARRARPALGCLDRKKHAPTGQPKLRPPQDWAVSLSELLRMIQFYNAGCYGPAQGTEDGFSPCPFYSPS